VKCLHLLRARAARVRLRAGAPRVRHRGGERGGVLRQRGLEARKVRVAGLKQGEVERVVLAQLFKAGAEVVDLRVLRGRGGEGRGGWERGGEGGAGLRANARAGTPRSPMK
jgi:hypothetical protein